MKGRGMAITILDFGLNTYVYSLNDAGQVTGFGQDSAGTHGFVYSDAGFTPARRRQDYSIIREADPEPAGAVA